MEANRETLKKIIVDGDITLLLDLAKQLGGELARQLTTSQIRNIFGEVRRIELNWPAHANDRDIGATVDNGNVVDQRRKAQQAYRQVVLLRPKLAYQSRRERGRGVEVLSNVLDPCLELIQVASTDKDRREYFGRFVDFFEAILAYHKAAGGV